MSTPEIKGVPPALLSKFKLITAVHTKMIEERRGDFKAILPAHLAWVAEMEAQGGILGPRGPVSARVKDRLMDASFWLPR